MSARHRTSLLIAVPFVLLFSADRVEFTTRMYQDVSGVRRLHVEGDSSLLRQLAQWSRETTRGFNTDRLEITSNRATIARSEQRADLDGVDDIDAQAYDIVRSPLSLVTTYHFRDKLRVDFTYGTPKELAPAPLTEFQYTLVMPGRITQASPAGMQQGNVVRWTLKADQPEVELSATAVSWRWDVILVLLYLVAAVAYRVTAFVIHQARMRPRKI